MTNNECQTTVGERNYVRQESKKTAEHSETSHKQGDDSCCDLRAHFHSDEGGRGRDIQRVPALHEAAPSRRVARDTRRGGCRRKAHIQTERVHEFLPAGRLPCTFSSERGFDKSPERSLWRGLQNPDRRQARVQHEHVNRKLLRDVQGQHDEHLRRILALARIQAEPDCLRGSEHFARALQRRRHEPHNGRTDFSGNQFEHHAGIRAERENQNRAETNGSGFSCSLFVVREQFVRGGHNREQRGRVDNERVGEVLPAAVHVAAKRMRIDTDPQKRRVRGR